MISEYFEVFTDEFINNSKIAGRGLQPRPKLLLPGSICNAGRPPIAGRGLQPRPKLLLPGLTKNCGRGCKPRPAEGFHNTLGRMIVILIFRRNGPCA